MFVHYAVLVPVPLGSVEQHVDALKADHLHEWADIAYRKGESLRARVGPSVEGVAKEVRLELGDRKVHRHGLVYPIKWIATGASLLFPAMTADLVLSHAGPIRTQISFEGTYEPPMGPLGKVIDRIALRRFAESTVKDFVDRIARALEAESVS